MRTVRCPKNHLYCFSNRHDLDVSVTTKPHDGGVFGQQSAGVKNAENDHREDDHATVKSDCKSCHQ